MVDGVSAIVRLSSPLVWGVSAVPGATSTTFDFLKCFIFDDRPMHLPSQEDNGGGSRVPELSTDIRDADPNR
jgi:hypothetical protein